MSIPPRPAPPLAPSPLQGEALSHGLSSMKGRRVLRVAPIPCFIAGSLFEAERIVQRERPELVLVATESLPEELDNFIASMSETVRRVSVTSVAGGSSASCYHQELLLPVVDIELFELIEDVIHEQGEAEGIWTDIRFC